MDTKKELEKAPEIKAIRQKAAPRLCGAIKKSNGEPCKSRLIKPEWGFHCRTHADNLEGRDLRGPGDKMRATMLMKNRIRLGEALIAEMEAETYNAVEELRKIKTVNPNPLVDFGTEKYVFALWLLANQETRQPQTLEAMATLLGVGVDKLDVWKRSKDILNTFDYVQQKFMKRHRRLRDISLLISVAAGDVAAMKMYREEYPPEPQAPVNFDNLESRPATKSEGDVRSTKEDGDHVQHVSDEVNASAQFEAEHPDVPEQSETVHPSSVFGKKMAERMTFENIVGSSKEN